jgi:hypothetical protein
VSVADLQETETPTKFSCWSIMGPAKDSLPHIRASYVPYQITYPHLALWPLQRNQNAVLRIIKGCHQKSPIQQLHSEAKTQSSGSSRVATRSRPFSNSIQKPNLFLLISTCIFRDISSPLIPSDPTTFLATLQSQSCIPCRVLLTPLGLGRRKLPSSPSALVQSTSISSMALPSKVRCR